MSFEKNFFLSLSLLCLSCSGAPSLKIIKAETFFNNLSSEPETLHPIRSTDTVSSIVQSHILESLLNRDSDSYEWQPSLAKKWNQSKDGKSFSFELFEGLKWSDGKELTAQDVKFSFEAYRNPKYGGIRHISYLEKIESAKVLSPTKILFTVKEPYFLNFDVIANMAILPAHIYKDPKAKLSKTVVGSGPYLLDRYIKGKIMLLKKNPFWAHRADLPHNKGKWKFKTIAFRFVQNAEDVRLRMEKGHIDYSGLTAETFFEKTNQPPWGKELLKVKYSNKAASGYSYIGLNLKKPLFQDKRVRKALAHLLNRKLMNKKFRHGQSELARGPWYFWSDFADPSVQPIAFDPKRAIHLLKEAGWKDEDKNGILEKTLNGVKREFSFSLLYADPDGEKYLTLYQEDLKKAGIELKLQNLDWASLLRMLDDRSFFAVRLGWSGGIDFDPRQIWHSKSAREKGSNYINYSNPEVDALIDKGRGQLDRQKRIKTFRKIYRIIAEDVPYIFMFNERKHFYGINRRIKTPAPALNYGIGMEYWCFSSDL